MVFSAAVPADLSPSSRYPKTQTSGELHNQSFGVDLNHDDLLNTSGELLDDLIGKIEKQPLETIAKEKAEGKETLEIFGAVNIDVFGSKKICFAEDCDDEK